MRGEGYDGAPLDDVVGNYDGDVIDERRSRCRHPLHGRKAGREGLEDCYNDENIKCYKWWLWQGTDYLDDTALYVYDQDLNKDLEGKQGMVLYTIGLYVDYCMLKRAAEYTTGHYYAARDAREIKEAFEEIMADIVARTMSGGAVAVAVVSTEERIEGEQDKMVRARFHPDGWRGYLEAFVIPDKIEDYKDWPSLTIYPDDDEDTKREKAETNRDLVREFGSWRHLDYSDEDEDLHKRGAHYLLRRRHPDTRKIFTFLREGVSMKKIEFKADNWDRGDPEDYPTSGLPESRLWKLLGAADEEEARDIIDYIRGKEPSELGRPKWRKRQHDFLEDWQYYLPTPPGKDVGTWRLSDIITSSPVQSGPPGELYPWCDYKAFRIKYKDRERMVYVGSNCMFHGFEVGKSLEDGGEERWAYIPRNLLGKLKELTSEEYCHLYYCDLTPVVKDVKLYEDKNPPYKNYRTILIGGQGRGGGVYFCLDVTGNEETGLVDYDSVDILWEYSDERLGESWSPPEIAMTNNGKWACFITSGPDKEGDYHDALHVIDIRDGSLIRRISVDTGNKDTWLTPPAGVDLHLDWDIDYIYAGDTQGNLWKFDLTSSDPNEWRVWKLFVTKSPNGDPQPITARPALGYGPKYEILVNFGTGKFEVEEDLSNLKYIKYGYRDTFYCIFDTKGGEMEIYRSELADKTDDYSRTVPPNKYGWYIDLGKHIRLDEGKAPKDPRDEDCDPKEEVNEGEEYYRCGERVTREALVYRGITIFSSFVPLEEACEAGAWAYLYAVHYSTGGNPYEPVMDVTDDMKVDEQDTIVRSRALDKEAKDVVAVGVPSKPMVDHRHDLVLTQTSLGGRIAVVKVSPPSPRIRVRSWRELF
jgi:type IV pilus assembly protein PilY1